MKHGSGSGRPQRQNSTAGALRLPTDRRWSHSHGLAPHYLAACAFVSDKICLKGGARSWHSTLRCAARTQPFWHMIIHGALELLALLLLVAESS